jgi:hypothetical protein
MKYWIAFLLSGLLFLNMLLLIKFKRQQAKTTEIMARMETLEIVKDGLIEKVILASSMTTPVSMDETIHFKDTTGQEFSVKESPHLFQNKVVLRFTQNNCGSCVEHELIHLKELAKSIGEENIVCLTSYTGINDIKILSDTYSVNFATYNVPINALYKNGYDTLNFPYVFRIDNNLQMSNFFIPAKENSALSKAYYKLMKATFEN